VSEQARSEELHAYHDGELGVLRRLWLERRLRRDPTLRQELEALASVSQWVRDSQPGEPEADLWSQLAPRLRLIDAEVELEQDATAPARPRGALAWLRRPLPAGAVAAAVAGLALAVVSLLTGGVESANVIRSLDPQGHRVMVLPANEGATVIWMFEGDEPRTSQERGHRGRGWT